MRRIILGLTMVLLGSYVIAQNNFPTKAECEKYIYSNDELRKEVVELMGMPWDKLTIKNDNWKGYKGTIFSTSITDCGYKIRKRGGAWPDDAVYAKWIVTTPKNAQGIYKEAAIYMDFKRTTFDGEYCRLGDWFFNGYRIEGGAEYGHKEFTTEEIKNIFFNEFKAGKISALKNFIEVKEINNDNDFNQNVPQPGQRYLYIYFRGTEVHAADDYSVIYCASEGGYKLTLSVEKDGEEWFVTNSKIDDRDPAEEPLPLGQYCYMDIDDPVENFETYGSAGFEAVYGKKTPRGFDGKYGDLMNRIEALVAVLKEKGAEIQPADLEEFIQPSMRSELDDPSINISSSNVKISAPFHTDKSGKTIQLKEAKYGGAIFISQEINGEMLELALPNIEMKFERMMKKGKKWLPAGGNTVRATSNSEPDANHYQAWIMVDGQWYLYDVPAAFSGSAACNEYIESLIEE
jgi:hypothetical protein